MNIAIIGAGNVGAWMAFAFHRAGHTIKQIFSLHNDAAVNLAKQYQAEPITDLKQLNPTCDLYVFSIKDNFYEECLQQIPFIMNFAVHTAGSISMNIFQQHANHYGVLYPYQTISKGMNFTEVAVPLCIESNHEESIDFLTDTARQLSDNVFYIDEQQRFTLHIAAVFASNFTNALYHIGFNILESANIDRKIIIPLLQNTLDKVKVSDPCKTQTGPAIRHDNHTIQKQLATLSDPLQIKIYGIMTQYIQTTIENEK